MELTESEFPSVCPKVTMNNKLVAPQGSPDDFQGTKAEQKLNKQTNSLKGSINPPYFSAQNSLGSRPWCDINVPSDGARGAPIKQSTRGHIIIVNTARSEARETPVGLKRSILRTGTEEGRESRANRIQNDRKALRQPFPGFPFIWSWQEQDSVPTASQAQRSARRPATSIQYIRFTTPPRLTIHVHATGASHLTRVVTPRLFEPPSPARGCIFPPTFSRTASFPPNMYLECHRFQYESWLRFRTLLHTTHR